MKLLLVDDDPKITSSLYILLNRSFLVHTANKIGTAMERLATNSYDIILLDLSLPDGQGRTLCMDIRRRGIKAPIVIISGTSDSATKINLLESGANDYLTKPFNTGELLARVRIQVRQRLDRTTQRTVRVGDLKLDSRNQQVLCNGQVLLLRRREYLVLECLMLNAPYTVHHDVLSQYVWDELETTANNVHVHITNLRKKLRSYSSEAIQTNHGIGYALGGQVINKRPPKVRLA